MPVVLIPTAYRGPTRGKAEVEVPAGTILACIEKVEEFYPGFMPLVIDDNGRVQRFVKLFVNEESIDTEELTTVEIGDTDRLDVVASVAGG